MFSPALNYGPYGSFGTPVPIPLSKADEGELVYIGVNCEWLPYIAGALTQLQLQSTWQYSTDAELLDIQNRVNTLISRISCFVLPKLSDLCGEGPNTPGVEISDDMPLFRQEGCLFQVQCADGSWTTIYDPTNCINSGAVNPTPQPNPPAGDCQEYGLKVPGNGLALLPVLVSAGDTIEILVPNGAWSGDNGTQWNCADGSTFVLGGCVGSPGTSGTDPLPASPHMSLIAKIGSTYYQLMPGVFPVPSGVTDNSIMTFQANDSDLTDNVGTISAIVKVCKAPPGTVGITYSVGSGPANVPYDTPFTVTSAATGGVEAFDMTFSPCIHLTILGYSGFVEIGSGGANDWASWDCAIVEHDGPLSNSGSTPLDWVPGTEAERLTIEGSGGFPFTTLMKVELV